MLGRIWVPEPDRGKKNKARKGWLAVYPRDSYMCAPSPGEGTLGFSGDSLLLPVNMSMVRAGDTADSPGSATAGTEQVIGVQAEISQALVYYYCTVPSHPQA